MDQLVHPLLATKLENKRLRRVALPQRTNQELDKLLVEGVVYQWMQTLEVHHTSPYRKRG